MDKFDKSVMVALVPSTTSWSRIDFPHLTLVYAGEIPDIPAGTHNDLSKIAFDIAHTFGPIKVPVTDVDKFGDAELVDVLRFEETPELTAMHKALQYWDKSKHPFSPHGTVGPAGSIVGLTVPEVVVFDRITVDWGKDRFDYVLQGPSNSLSDKIEVGVA